MSAASRCVQDYVPGSRSLSKGACCAADRGPTSRRAGIGNSRNHMHNIVFPYHMPLVRRRASTTSTRTVNVG